jgi:hypothetical protein
MSERTLNPDIKEINIGIKEVHPIKIYPLSIQDQFDITNRLVDVISQFGDQTNFESNEDALKFLQEIITDNLSVILEYVTTEDDRPTFRDLTNNQCYEIAEVIFQVNYEAFVKNSQNLIERVMELLPKQ